MTHYRFFGVERGYLFHEFSTGDSLPHAPGILTGFKERESGLRILYLRPVKSLFLAQQALTPEQEYSLRLGETHAAYLQWRGKWDGLQWAYEDLLQAHKPPCNTTTVPA